MIRLQICLPTVKSTSTFQPFQIHVWIHVHELIIFLKYFKVETIWNVSASPPHLGKKCCSSHRDCCSQIVYVLLKCAQLFWGQFHHSDWVLFLSFFALPDSQSDIICKCDVWLCALAERTTLSGWENESKSSGTTLQ